MGDKQTKPAVYLTQGTVRLELNLESPKRGLYVVINPVAEYVVTHMGVKYTVFVPKPEPTPKPNPASKPNSVQKKVLEARVCRSSDPHPISVPDDRGFLRQILKDAALTQSKVELELRANDQELELVGVKVPAPTEAGAASHI